MSLLALGLFGFLLGLRHAMEADHLAAVASLATRTKSVAEGVRLGAVWGLGHTITLFLVGLVVLLVDTLIPEDVAAGLELAVGLMLIVLGLDVLRVWVRRPVRFDIHEHDDGETHLHAYRGVAAPEAKDGDAEAKADAEADHEHPRGIPLRALFVGFVHGMAGSAALVLLALGKAPSVATGLLYIAVFGLGSIVGMAMLSVVVSVPLRWSSKSLGWLHGGVQATIGVATILIGVTIVFDNLGWMLR